MKQITVCGNDVANQSIHSGSFFSEWALFLFVAFFAAAYVFAILFLRKRRCYWRPLNAVSFLIGITMVLIAFSPDVMIRAHDSIKVHMMQHILVAMFAPIFLVLGRPVILMLKVIPAKLARRLMAILRSKVSLLLGHPLVGFILSTGGMFAIYLTDLYAAALNNAVLHFVVHIHFLVAGYVFTWSVIGLDPVPVRPGFRFKVAVVFLSIACHAFLSKFMYAFSFPMATGESVAALQEAAKLMYYWGDLSELLLLVALFRISYSRHRKSLHSVTRLTDPEPQQVAISVKLLSRTG